MLIVRRPIRRCLHDARVRGTLGHLQLPGGAAGRALARVPSVTVDGAGLAVLHAVVAVADGSVRTKDEMRVF